jgi:hypothetical protein
MNEVFYAFPFQAMAQQIVGGTVPFFIGLHSLISKLFNKRTSSFKRVGLASLGTLVILLGIFSLGATAYIFMAGAETLDARLAQNRVIESNDPNGGGVIPTYRLYFGDASQFDSRQETYAKMILGNCYRVVYSPGASLMQMLGQCPASTVRGGPVTSINENPSPQCL